MRPVSSGAPSPASSATPATRCGRWSATRPGPTALDALGVELVPGDLDDAAALDRLCAGVDGLFHVAGWYKLGQRDPSVGDRVNVEGTRNVLAAAQRAGVPRVVYTSTLAVNSDTEEQVDDETYRPPASTSATTTAPRPRRTTVAERLAADGLPVVIVQPGLVYGPGDTAQTGALIAQVVRGKRPQVPAGGGVCWAHVDDVAAGHVLAMESGDPGETYMLAGPRATLADGLKQVARSPAPRGRWCCRRGWCARRRRWPARSARRTAAAGLRRGDHARLAGDLLRLVGQGRAGARLARPGAGHGTAARPSTPSAESARGPV